LDKVLDTHIDFFSENALKLTHGIPEFKFFPARSLGPPPAGKRREEMRRKGKEEEGTEWKSCSLLISSPWVTWVPCSTSKAFTNKTCLLPIKLNTYQFIYLLYLCLGAKK
jgi:hypothetical protein